MSALEYRTSVEDPAKYIFSFSTCQRHPMQWRDELAEAARSIANEAGSRPLWLCSSGGIDSEVMCQIFLDLGIHFSVLTLRHTQLTNQHDIQFAEEWCRLHGVPQKIVDIDMEEFINIDVFRYAQEGYITGNIFRYFQIRLLEIVDSMGGYAVLGGGEQLYRANQEIPDIFLNFDIGYIVPLEWCRRNKKVHEPYFYFHTPEILRSFLNIPVVEYAVAHRALFRNYSNAFVFKRFVMQSEFPNLKPRKKFNGFENVVQSRLSAEAKLRELFNGQLYEYQITVSQLREQLGP